MRFRFLLFLVLLSSFAHAATVFSGSGVEGNPVAKIVCPEKKLTVGISYTFDGSFSEGIGLSESWNFGDGSSGSEPVHVFSAAGIFRISLTVTDSSGASSVAECFVNAEFEPKSVSIPELPFGLVILSVVALSLLLFKD